MMDQGRVIPSKPEVVDGKWQMKVVLTDGSSSGDAYLGHDVCLRCVVSLSLCSCCSLSSVSVWPSSKCVFSFCLIVDVLQEIKAQCKTDPAVRVTITQVISLTTYSI